MPSERPEHRRAFAFRQDQEPRAVPLSESLGRLERAVSEIHDSETFRRYLDAQARFHNYSWGNVLLIMAQRPHATQVAGFRTWQSMGRYVRRGEKGIRIIVPYTHRHEPDFDDEEPKVFTCFRSGSVFDVSQTEGAPLPEVPVPTLEGEQGRELYDRLGAIALAEGVSVQQAHELGGERMGYYDPVIRQIVVRRAPPRQMTKTLAHELAHHFCQHQASDPESETQAEGIAYVVLAHFGVDSGARSFPYVATWAQDRNVLKGALSTIQTVSSGMIDRLLVAEEEFRGPSPKVFDPPPRFLNGCGAH